MLISRRNFLKKMSGILLASAIPGNGTQYSVASSSNVLVGVLASLTGPLASIGGNSLNGFKMAAEEINSQGGILGKALQVVIFDSGKMQDAVRSMHMFKQKYNSIAIIGSDSVRGDKLLSQLAEDIKVPFFILNPFRRTWYSKGLKFTFMLSPEASRIAVQSLDYLSEIAKNRMVSINKIGLFWVDSPSISEARDRIVASAAHRGLSLVYDFKVSYNVNRNKLKNSVIDLKRQSPDLVFLLVGGQFMSILVKTMKEQNVKTKAIMGFFSELGNAAFVAQQGKALINLMDANYWGNPKLTETKQFVTEYRKKFGNFPSNSSYSSYTATYIVRDAIVSAGSMDRYRVGSALREKEFPRYLLAQKNPVKFDETGRNYNADTVLLQVSNPRPIPIYPVVFSERRPVFPISQA